MKFNSATEIYDTIHNGTDLYDVTKGIYLFDYNWVGAIAYYYLSNDELLELAEEVGPDNYVSSGLGPGGYVIDVNLVAPDDTIIYYDDPEFDDYYDAEDYELDYSEILDFLSKLVGDEFI